MPHCAREFGDACDACPQQMWPRVEQVAAENIGSKHFHSEWLVLERNSKRAQRYQDWDAEMSRERCSFHDA
jgi:hypothetical protein